MDNNLQVDVTLHMDTLSLLPRTPVFGLPQNASCLADKQQIYIISLVNLVYNLQLITTQGFLSVN